MQLGCEKDNTIGTSCLTFWYLSVLLTAANWLEPLIISPLNVLGSASFCLWVLWVDLNGATEEEGRLFLSNGA